MNFSFSGFDLYIILTANLSYISSKEIPCLIILLFIEKIDFVLPLILYLSFSFANVELIIELNFSMYSS